MSSQGVSGSGKSTLGENTAQALGVPFYDGDQLHPQSNIDKMAQGIPLTDADREPWLALIRATADRICESENRPDQASENPTQEVKGIVVACSALKKYYRDILRGVKPQADEPPPASDLPSDHPITEHVDQEKEHQLLKSAASKELKTFFVYIKGTREVLVGRMKSRKGHFMKVNMLDSQLATLEDPTGEENVVVVHLEESPEQQLKDAVEGLRAVGFHDAHVRLSGEGARDQQAAVST